MIDGSTGTSSSFDVNEATFADGSIVNLAVTSIGGVDGAHTILTADALTGTPGVDLSDGFALPQLFTGSLTQDDQTITRKVHRRSAEELGLTGSQREAFDVIFSQASAYSVLEASLLESGDLDGFLRQFDALLQDYSGCPYDWVLIVRPKRVLKRRLKAPKEGLRRAEVCQAATECGVTMS